MIDIQYKQKTSLDDTAVSQDFMMFIRHRDIFCYSYTSLHSQLFSDDIVTALTLIGQSLSL